MSATTDSGQELNMSFNLSMRQFMLLLFLLFTFQQGCGLLGNREGFNKIAQYNPASIGCLNQMGSQFSRYLDGKIDATEWDSTWSCATDSLSVYQRFVQGSDSQGYTPEDIHSFLSKFLYSGTPISKELVRSSFLLKQSLFGGSATVLTKEELDRFIRMLNVGRETTLRLLPYLQKQEYFKSADEYKNFAQTLMQLGTEIGKNLSTQSNPELTFLTLQTIAQELSTIFHWDISHHFNKQFSAVKRFLIAGSNDALEAQKWPKFFELLTTYSAPLLAWKSMNWSQFKTLSEGGDFVVELFETLKKALNQSIDLHTGGIPFSVFDQMIDELSIGFFQDVQKETLKQTLRPLFNRLLHVKKPGIFDSSGIEKIETQFKNWQRGQKHIQNIFDRYQKDPDGFLLKDYIDSVLAYRETYAGSGDHEAALDIYRILLLGRDHRPHLVLDSGEIEFTPFFKRTLNSISRFHAIELIVRTIFQSYSDTQNRDRATVEEFKQFVDDFKQIAFEMKITEITPTGYLKRFNEMNLFVYSSNGDDYLDVNEGMEYASFLLSMKNFGKRVFLDGIAKQCPSLGKDPMGWDWVGIECFQKEFITNRHEYWKHFPGLIQFFDQLSPKEQSNFEQVMQKGARRFGLTNQPVSSFDMDGYAGLMHYLEALIQRFDYDFNQHLSLSEIMNAYPLFKNTLAKFANLDPVQDNGTLEAVFTYTVHYGEAPKKDILHLIKFLWWQFTRPFWSINASRYDLYTVISVFTSKQ